MKHSIALFIAFAVTIGWYPALSATSVLKSGSNCVAYKTRKTLALVSQADVVGINCGISVTAAKLTNGRLAAEIRVPIAGFNSNDRDRDVWVAQALKAHSHPTLTIRTESLTPAAWQGLLKRGGGSVKGQLGIGGRTFSVSTQAKIVQKAGQIEVSGVIVTKFTSFGIAPPEVGPGGIIAKAPDYLELHYNFHSGHLQNKRLIPGL